MESLNRRREMGSKDVCPYQRVEYLQGVKGNTNFPRIQLPYFIKDYYTEIVVKVEPTEIASSFIITNQYNTDNNFRLVFSSPNNRLGIQFKYNSLAIGAGAEFIINDLRIYRFHAFALDNNCIIEDIDTKENLSTNINTPFENPYPLVLFGSHTESSVGSSHRLYYLKLFHKGKLLFDLIPVRIGDEGFMYDKVSGKLFGNSGEGKFILGPDIN